MFRLMSLRGDLPEQLHQLVEMCAHVPTHSGRRPAPLGPKARPKSELGGSYTARPQEYPSANRSFSRGAAILPPGATASEVIWGADRTPTQRRSVRRPGEGHPNSRLESSV
jgi:hypothetical protein